jgi:large subunit ribosomal protein L9
MKVIFKDTSQVKDVKFGYAVHHLIPKGLAVVATEEKLKELAALVEEGKKRLGQEAEKAQAFLSLVSGKAVTISLKAKGKKLFGSVTKARIKKELEALGKSALPAKLEIALPKPIKAVGTHQVDLKIGKASAQIKVTVKRA